MELILWGFVFVVALLLVVKGADWFLDSAEKIGLRMGLSSFVVGVVIVGLGTSLPELVSSFAALLQGSTEIVAANVVGSNIVNILLIMGLAAMVGGKLAVSKNLIDLDIPLLAMATTFGVITMLDGLVTPIEAVFLVLVFIVFLTYSIRNGGTSEDNVRQLFSFRPKHAKIEITDIGDDPKQEASDKLTVRDFVWLVIGLGALIFGGQYLVQSVVNVSVILSVGVGAISLIAIAVGTSLPELVVSIKAARQGKHEVAVGNIFGSNIFNILFVLGLPGLFMPLKVDVATATIGIPFMIIATLFFVLSGMSRRIHSYEGAIYILVYIFFIGKLFGLF